MQVKHEPKGSVWTIVVAGGSGSRFGAAKQFVELAGVSVLDRSVLTAAKHSDGVVVVVPAPRLESLREGLGSLAWCASVEWRAVAGGSTRSASVRNGLAAVPVGTDVVLVHDAVRPLASDAIFARVIAAVLGGSDAGAPALPLTDTVWHRSTGVVDRNELVALQTPQAFRTEVLRRAHQDCPEATDDVSLVADRGGSIELVSGEQRNLKLTTPYDLEVAKLHLSIGSQS